MRHAFVPMSNGSDRCARCLRHLDCAPHLPIAPTPISVELSRALHKSIATESRFREAAIRKGYDPPPAVSRAAR